METSSRLIPLVDDLTHILIEAGKNKGMSGCYRSWRTYSPPCAPQRVLFLVISAQSRYLYLSIPSRHLIRDFPTGRADLREFRAFIRALICAGVS
jgi:hypothetical protein